MLTNYESSHFETDISYEKVFDDCCGNGFTFPCDQNGNLHPDLTKQAVANYNFCLQHPEMFQRFNKVIRHKQRYRTNPRGTCECGTEIELYSQYMGACQCPTCGKWYNLSGQELLPPQFWDN